MEESPVRIAVLPSSEKRLKKLGPRRRRIRNDSGGIEGIRKVAITVSRIPKTDFLGLKLDIVRHAKEKLPATDRAVSDQCMKESPNIVALSHALAVTLQLSLQDVPVEVYLDGNHFGSNGLEGEIEASEFWANWHRRLVGEFANLVVEYTRGGNNLQLLKSKMGNAKERESRGDTNFESVREWAEKLEQLLT